MLKTLVDVSIKHARGDGADKMPVIYSDNDDGASDVSRAASAAELRWGAFSNVYREFSPVDQLRGTDRDVGIGILTLARKLWQINPCHESTSEMPYQGKDTRYSAYLVPPLRKLLAKMTANHPTKEDITTALSIIDTIRAIPYVELRHHPHAPRRRARDDRLERLLGIRLRGREGAGLERGRGPPVEGHGEALRVAQVQMQDVELVRRGAVDGPEQRRGWQEVA